MLVARLRDMFVARLRDVLMAGLCDTLAARLNEWRCGCGNSDNFFSPPFKIMSTRNI